MNTMDREEMRKAFEEWFSEGGKWPKSVERDEKGRYILMSAANAWIAWQAAMAHSEAAIVEAIARQWDGCMAPMFDLVGNLTGPIDIGETIRADAALSRHGG